MSIKKLIVPTTMFLLLASSAFAGDAAVQINTGTLGFAIPTFSDLLTFLVKFFFVIAGLAALFFLLWGALSWVTSGGDKDNVAAARGKIVSALVGVLVIIATLTVIWSLEQIVFKGKLCFGISCPLNLPTLLK
ncbi:hypothetical protein A3D06_00025 [Candidatus Roizmanbacteria bacterium RIFCSPHIGHO2_02_FULL_40_9]|uniref:DUF5671 domain-containing protein n=1 Tax=Candidatus Roizmanbacteria bacterium RIFCSPHIGHO2_02_FULL_40_9 TaxID=1802042 RepID=A0A1F7HDX8_9BACT|nr:MAG: hypothetical protein A3D06_00025 [Candidatus Roizmanbacteria bacterium RIFCSPHIGHO2_02_FULL_40_9]